MAPMSYAAIVAKDSGGTTGAVSAGVTKPKTSPTHSSTKKPSSGSKKSTSPSKKPVPTATGLESALRRSLRLEGKPPEIDPLPTTGKTKEQNKNFVITSIWGDKTREGASLKKRFRKNKITGSNELVAYRADRGPEHFYPGMIIRATEANYQTKLKLCVDELDDKVRKDLDIMVHKDGPVYSKKRPMVVLYKTLMGLMCVPMFSNTEGIAGSSNKRWSQIVSATRVGDESWEGKTPWAGKPLIFEAYEIEGGQPLHDKCFINIAEPIHISNYEEIHVKMGRLSGDQYCRLINAFMFRQYKLLKAAFADYGEERGLKNLWEAWQSQKSGDMLWPAEKSEEWKQMEANMSEKSPQIVSETGEYTLV
ncbi:unnamed protein product [Aureobasidium mustum]|uniref:Uncharacterized protein n=1 Tax=Aureobasidium mustum TaxID=2773714 RepID=A0A9N8PIW7_9PEZI|nr:unnamed protein product [Aureobasidium mustum]